ncbi:MAG: AAA family ATPase [Saprospiraceae bacterium]
MDIQYFFNVIKKRKWLIIFPMIITALATYFFVDRQAEVYDAKASIPTGIVEFTGINMNENSPFVQKMQVEISFANLISFITTNKTTRFLSYELLVHDILADSTTSDPPFKKINPSDFGYSQADLEALAGVLQGRIDTLNSALDEEADRIYRKVAKAYKYDVDYLKREKFYVKRDGETDALEIKYVDENPRACSFAVNQFCKILKPYHQLAQSKGDLETYYKFERLAQTRGNTLQGLEKELENYKSGKGILNISIQSEETLNQIANLEAELEEANRKVNANRTIIKNLGSYLNDNDRYKLETKSGNILNSKAIINLDARIKKLNDQYISSGQQDNNLKSQIELAKVARDQQIKRIAKEQSKDDPGTMDQDDEFLSKRVTAESELTLAQETILSVNNELDKLRGQRNAFINDEAYTRNLEEKIEIERKKYKSTVDRVNESEFKTISSNFKLEPLDWADTPEDPIPDNKYLMAGFAGLLTATLATVLLFLLALFDLSLNTPNQFNKFTNLNLIGSLNKVKDSNLDLKQLFASFSDNTNLENFKESLRKLRYAFEESDASTFLITSTKEGEGKTFLILTLAYTLTLKDKKILLIDTNFKNNTLTRMSNEKIQDNLLHTRLIGENNLADQFEAKKINNMFNLDNVDIIGNRGTSHSPSEFFAGRDFQNFISDLKENYDYIFLEGASLNKYSDTRELVRFADKIVAVFSAESEIKDIDKESIDYLLSKEDKFFGSVLNKIDLKNMN